MARDPGSVWAPLPEAGAPDGCAKNKFIFHSTGDNGTAAATRRYFELEGIVAESTFIIGQGPWDPTLQIMDSTDVADANMAANDEAISAEVVGDGIGGYNDWQRSECIRLGLWARREHPLILPQVIPSAAQSAAGFGWHVMFGAPGPWTGVAKVCPGKQRIKELASDIFPAIFAGIDVQEDDVNADQDKLIRETRDIVGGLAYLLNPPGGEAEGEILTRLRDLSGLTGALRDTLADPAGLANAMRAHLGDLGAASGAPTQEQLEAALRNVLGSLDAAK